MWKPITPARHGLIDYGFGAVFATLPNILGLQGSGKAIPMVWALGQGALNAMTDQPFAISRRVPFRTHGLLEGGALPTLIGVTAASGAMRDPKNRRFFIGMFALLVANYLLTNYNATPER